jgi:2'-5' RNA ligase
MAAQLDQANTLKFAQISRKFVLRLFVSCDIEDPNVIEKIVGFQKSVLSDMDGVKLVEPENMHFSIAFLGEQKESVLVKLTKVLERVEFSESVLELRGIRGFPSHHTPRVVVVEVGRGAEALESLARRVRELLDDASIWYDRAQFVPHMTLARLRSPSRKVAETIMLHMDDAFGEVVCGSVKLKKSELTRTGALYTTLYEVKAKRS